METKNTWELLRKVPEIAKKKIGGGRLSGMTDINPVWRIQRMSELFGQCGTGWGYDIIKIWNEQGNAGEVACFVQISLWIKDGNSIPGVGGSMFVQKEKEGLRTNDEAVKMALTDALSVAMKALGMGADVYFEKGVGYGTKYETQESKPDAKTSDRQESLKSIAFAKDKAELVAIYNGLPRELQSDPEIIAETKKRREELTK